MSFGWEGEKIRLVPLDIEKHLANAIKWMNDPEVTAWLLVGDFPISELSEREYFDRMMKSNDSEVAFAMETLSGKHIGFSGLHKIDWRNGYATSGTVIGAKEEWGRGYGKDAARTRAQYAFEVLGLRMILSEVIDGNDRSLRMQQAVGYKVYGRVPRKVWKRGAYRDLILTYLERPE